VKGEVHDGVALVMAADDTVATALADLPAGRTFEVDGQRIELVEAVEFGHKFALVAHEAGDPVRKYGEVVGRASAAIRAGEHATHAQLRERAGAGRSLRPRRPRRRRAIRPGRRRRGGRRERGYRCRRSRREFRR